MSAHKDGPNAEPEGPHDPPPPVMLCMFSAFLLFAVLVWLVDLARRR